MKGLRTAQEFGGGLASNPANGIANIPLNSTEDSSGVKPDELLSILSKFINSDSASAVQFKAKFEDILLRLTRPDMIDAIQKIIKAIDMAQDPKKRTKDPNTGKFDPTAQELAQKLSDKVKMMEKSSSNQNSNVLKFNLREAQAKKPKKKTRGNPFRVLMGKVGKLLDHGLEKSEIRRYLVKLGMWNEETIERAIDIVRDYNKKKRRDDADGNKKESQMSSELMRLAESKLASMTDEEFDNFLNSRIAAKVLDNSIYDIPADFSKRSTTELMARATWLMSLMNYSKDMPQGDGKKPADTKGASAELKSIKKALEDRGFNADDLSEMGIK
jgi:hypothetical protein